MALRLLLVASLLAWAGVSWGWPSARAEMGSPSYRINRDVVNFGGGESRSSSWVSLSSLGEVAAGLSQSVNYVLNLGSSTQANASLSIAVDSGTASFGTVAPGTPSDASSEVTVTTDAVNGYSLSAQYSGQLSSGSATVADFAGTVASPQAWSGTGFGFSVSSGTNVDSKWSGGSAFAAFTTSATEIHAPSPTPGVPDVTGITYRVNVPAGQPSGSYATEVTYTAAPTL